MAHLIHEFISTAAEDYADEEALVCKNDRLSYRQLHQRVQDTAAGLLGAGLQKQDRVAIYLTKQIENVLGMFGTARAGGIFVPVNPVLKAPQVGHILRDSASRFLVTTADRLDSLKSVLEFCPHLTVVVLTDSDSRDIDHDGASRVMNWQELVAGAQGLRHRVIDIDIASILYTSGSTGNPKGVVLSHRNLVAGAESVASYIGNSQADRILAVLPFSFDVGFSQLSTAFSTGATVVLHDYFLPRDVLKVVEKEEINGITGVPPLWMQMVDQKWPKAVGLKLRYFANTGGKMPQSLLQRLREHFPAAKPYLMYGLTEAFRSTYLPPDEVDNRPDSIGKAIPNAEILVVREDGSSCDAGEAGELVHRGALVSMGYWNDPERTAERFKPVPGLCPNGVHEELAVWSGDMVKKDEDGFLYFIARKDGMLKTSGYRVSPTEVEEIAFASTLVSEAAAIGVEDERLVRELCSSPHRRKPEFRKAMGCFRL